VEHDVLERRARRERPPVHRDAVALRIRLGARLEPDLPVDGDAPGREQLFSCSP
jgi:hypothetical protein